MKQCFINPTENGKDNMNLFSELNSARLQDILNLIPHMVFIRDSNNRFLMINNAMADFYSLKPDEVIGKTLLELNPDKEEARRNFQDDLNVLSQGKPRIKDEVMVKKGQKDPHYFHIIKIPYGEPDHKKDKILGLMINISHVKSEENERKSYFSHLIHELRTPLNSIFGIVNLLKEKNDDEELAEDLDILKFSAENLMSMVNDFLDFSKIQAGKINIERRAFNLRELLNRISRSLLPWAKEKQTDINVLVDPTIPPTIEGDSLRLVQVVNNLLSNAVKFTEEGEISVSAKLLESNSDDLLISFTVKDTGIGIENDALEKLFEPFSQASMQTSRIYGGTGLGLSFTKQLVEALGGKIDVESQPGKGTSFSFELPFSKSGQASSGEEFWENESLGFFDPVNARVLMIEDNVMSIMLAKKIFSRWNIDLSLAETGNVALQKIKSQKFDIILLDLQMPDIDGFQIMEKIKDPDFIINAHTPVIAFTASSEKEIHEKAFNAGMADVVVKPYQPNELYDKMFSVLKKSILQDKQDRLVQKSGLRYQLQRHENVPSLLNKLERFAGILSVGHDLIITNYQQIIALEIIPELKRTGFDNEAEKTRDFLRLITTFSGKDKSLLIKSFQKELRNRVINLLEMINNIRNEQVV